MQIFKSFRSFLFESLETFVTTFVVIAVIYQFIAMPEMVWGASMEPNFVTGERILVEKVTKYLKTYQRGEVVVLNPPNDKNVDYIKRVIGLPGEIVKISNCVVQIKSQDERFVLEESYLDAATCTTSGSYFQEGRSVKIPDGEYLVLGDNREVSADSRYFGFVKKDMILGRVVFRFWPLDKVSFF